MHDQFPTTEHYCSFYFVFMHFACLFLIQFFCMNAYTADASRDLTQQCSDQFGQAKRPKFLLLEKNNVTGKGYPQTTLPQSKETQVFEKRSVWKILIHRFLNNTPTSFPLNVGNGNAMQ